MSHWTVAKLSIVNPNMELLKRALGVLAKELRGRMMENYTIRGYRVRKRVPLAVAVPLPYGNGYGIYIDENGYLRVVADDHGAPMTVREFAGRLQQVYTALAIAAVASELGFSVNMQELEGGRAILIDLER